MKKNRFYTLMLIPEKTSKVRKWILPGWVLRSGIFIAVMAIFLFGIMLVDYGFVMNQINEIKDLRHKNRTLTQKVQIYKNKLGSVEDTLDRIETFSTRLKIITNMEDKETLAESIPEPPAEAKINIPSKKKTSPQQRELAQNKLRINNELSFLQQKSLVIEQRVQDLYELLFDQKAFLAALPTRKPSQGVFTSGFGVRKSPYSGKSRMHEGIDIANRSGTTIVSPAFGVVDYVGLKPGYGRVLVINHGFGVETWFAHTRKILVKPRQNIIRGQKIALMGNTGRSTGPHLHYEVRIYGIPVDPLPYILED